MTKFDEAMRDSLSDIINQSIVANKAIYKFNVKGKQLEFDN
jgi:hypothetical protein